MCEIQNKKSLELPQDIRNIKKHPQNIFPLNTLMIYKKQRNIKFLWSVGRTGQYLTIFLNPFELKKVSNSYILPFLIS